MQVRLENVQDLADLRNRCCALDVLKIASEQHVFYSSEFCFRRNDDHGANSLSRHIKCVTSHEDLFKTSCAGDTHYHNVNSIISYITFNAFNKRITFFGYIFDPYSRYFMKLYFEVCERLVKNL